MIIEGQQIGQPVLLDDNTVVNACMLAGIICLLRLELAVVLLAAASEYIGPAERGIPVVKACQAEPVSCVHDGGQPAVGK